MNGEVVWRFIEDVDYECVTFMDTDEWTWKLLVNRNYDLIFAQRVNRVITNLKISREKLGVGTEFYEIH